MARYPNQVLVISLRSAPLAIAALVSLSLVFSNLNSSLADPQSWPAGAPNFLDPDVHPAIQVEGTYLVEIENVPNASQMYVRLRHGGGYQTSIGDPSKWFRDTAAGWTLHAEALKTGERTFSDGTFGKIGGDFYNGGLKVSDAGEISFGPAYGGSLMDESYKIILRPQNGFDEFLGEWRLENASENSGHQSGTVKMRRLKPEFTSVSYRGFYDRDGKHQSRFRDYSDLIGYAERPLKITLPDELQRWFGPEAPSFPLLIEVNIMGKEMWWGESEGGYFWAPENSGLALELYDLQPIRDTAHVDGNGPVVGTRIPLQMNPDLREGKHTLYLNGLPIELDIDFAWTSLDPTAQAEASTQACALPNWLSGRWLYVYEEDGGEKTGDLHLSLSGEGAFETSTFRSMYPEQLTREIDTCEKIESQSVFNVDGDNPGKLSMTIPDAPDTLIELVWKPQEGTGGREVWARPEVIVEGAVPVDLLPKKISRVLNYVDVEGESTKPLMLLKEAFGDDVTQAFWLRIFGFNLLTQEGMPLNFETKSPGMQWTGEYRIPYAVQPGEIEALDVRLALKADLKYGAHKFTLSGVEGEWELRPELEALDVAMVTGPETPVIPTDSVYPGGIFVIRQFFEAPSDVTREVMLRNAYGISYSLKMTLSSSRPNMYVSTPFTVTSTVNPNENDDTISNVFAESGTALEILNIGTRSTDLVQPTVFGEVEVRESPEGLFDLARQKAGACRADGAETEISNFLFTEGFSSTRIKIDRDDHAAAILLRDEVIAVSDEWIDNQKRMVNAPLIGVDQLSFEAVERDKREARRLIAAARAFQDDRLLDVKVIAPNTEDIPLRIALSKRMEEVTFEGDREKFEAYAGLIIKDAQRQRIREAEASLAQIRNIDVCDIEKLIQVLHGGVGNVTPRLLSKLVKKSNSGQANVPSLVPDPYARARVSTFSGLTAAIIAQQEYSSLDTDVALMTVTVATAGAGGVAGIAASKLPKVASIAWAARGLTWGARMLDGMDLVLTTNDIYNWRITVDAYEFSKGLVDVLGEERLRAATEARDAAEFAALAAGGGLFGASAIGKMTEIGRRQRAVAKANIDVKGPDKHLLNDAEFRDAVTGIGELETMIPRRAYAFHSDTLKAEEMLQEIGMSAKRAEAAVNVARPGLVFSPEEIVARVAAGSKLSPRLLMARLEMNSEELALTLDRALRSAGQADNVARARQIRNYLGADMTPPEYYWLAETGQLDSVFASNVPLRKIGATDAPGRRMMIHPKQLEENQAISTLQRFGYGRDDARQLARQFAGSDDPVGAAIEAGMLNNSSARQMIDAGIEPDVIARKIDGKVRDRHAFADANGSADGDTLPPPNIMNPQRAEERLSEVRAFMGDNTPPEYVIQNRLEHVFPDGDGGLLGSMDAYRSLSREAKGRAAYMLESLSRFNLPAETHRRMATNVPVFAANKFDEVESVLARVFIVTDSNISPGRFADVMNISDLQAEAAFLDARKALLLE